MKRTVFLPRPRRRGAAIISVVFFTMIISVLLMGITTYTVSHQNRAKTDSDYAAAIALAEAGINYEFNWISSDPAHAHQAGSKYTGTLPGGTFAVYCTGTGGGNWDGVSNNLYVIATGTVDTGAYKVTRTIKASAKAYPVAGNFAIYALDGVSVWNGSAVDIYGGDIGTNGQYDFTGHPDLHGGTVYFNGPGAGWYGGDPGGYTEVYNASPILWPTVSNLANTSASALSGTTKTGDQGLTWFSTNNDNATARNSSGGPGIVGTSISGNRNVTLYGKAGGANYYLTSINLTGSAEIILDNRNGPINLWVGPRGGSGTCRFRGNSAAATKSTDPANECHLYCATTTGVDLAGNQEMDVNIYAYDKDNAGADIGYVQNSGNPVVYGSILSKQVDMNGNVDIHYIASGVAPTTGGYYGYDNSWVEINPR